MRTTAHYLVVRLGGGVSRLICAICQWHVIYVMSHVMYLKGMTFKDIY